MSEKTIWPEWIIGRLPTYEEKKGRSYDDYLIHEDGVISFTDRNSITTADFWCLEPEGTHPGDYIDYIATPDECIARKKLNKAVGEKVIKELSLENQVNSYNNQYWIKGNEPDKEGWYEVTLERMSAVQVDYWDCEKWEDGNVVTAYKPITLSAPYVEPERELRCPFCDSLLTVIQYTGVKLIECRHYINKKECYFSMKSLDEHHEIIKKSVFEIYDKLNPKEG